MARARAGTSDDITTRLSLPRPFDTYAPRTQRRYRAAYAAGLDRERALERERIARSGQPTTRARTAARHLRRLGMNDNGSHDNDGITRLIAAAGPEEAARLLEQQQRSVEAYKRGDPTPGRMAWNHRDDVDTHGELMDIAAYSKYRVSR